MRVTGISFSKVASPQNGVIQDHNGRQSGETDWVDVLPKHSVHLERTGQELRKLLGVHWLKTKADSWATANLYYTYICKTMPKSLLHFLALSGRLASHSDHFFFCCTCLMGVCK